MAKLVALIVALAIFGSWMSVVGNPHVVETVIGVVISVIAGFWSYFFLRRLQTKWTASRGR